MDPNMQQATEDEAVDDLIESMHKKTKMKKLRGWNAFGILAALVSFIAMCSAGGLYTYMLKDSVYKNLSIVIPIAAIMPLLAGILILITKDKAIKVVIALYAISFVCVFASYRLIFSSTGGNATTYEFYGRRIMAIWTTCSALTAVFSYLACRKKGK